MGFETRTVDKVCPHCGAKHKVTWNRLPFREPYRLFCKRCRKLMDEGKSVCDYDAPRLVSDE